MSKFKIGDRVTWPGAVETKWKVTATAIGTGIEMVYVMQVDGDAGFVVAADQLTHVAPLDALGRPVPAWAREAFDVLAKDGRRVALRRWPGAIGSMMDEAPLAGLGEWRNGDATIDQTFVAVHVDDGGPRIMVLVGRVGVPGFEHFESVVDAARRAVAMEAERKTVAAVAHVAAGIGAYVGGQAKEAADHFAHAERLTGMAVAAKSLTARLGAEHRCSLCNGPARPAYTGFFSHEPEQCLREGGCLATREPRVDDAWDEDETTEIAIGRRRGREDAFTVVATERVYALRSDAIAAWRKAALDRAWGRT